MTLYLSNRDGNGKTSEEGHYKFQTGVWTGNVLGAAALKVTQNSPLAMNVVVAAGQFKIDTPDDYSYTGWNNSAATIAISTADPANPRITTIVAYVDKSAPTSASPPNNPGIVKLKAVNGSAAASPVAPNDAAIQSSVGTGNPFIKLANVTVPAAASNIVNANIADVRVLVGIPDSIIQGSNIELRSNPAAYPIGSLYFNASVNTNPSILLGFGTWAAFGAGRVITGFNAAETEFNAVEKTGGAKTHQLTVGQLPAISGSWGIHGQENGTEFAGLNGYATGSYARTYTNTTPRGGGAGSYVNPGFAFGSNQAHPILQPYITVYIWKRTA